MPEIEITLVLLTKLEILNKIEIFEILGRNRNFSPKSKFFTKIEIILNLGRSRVFRCFLPKSIFFEIFTEIKTFNTFYRNWNF